MGNKDFVIKSKQQSIDVGDIKGGLNFNAIANDPKLIDIFKKCDKNGNNILDSNEISVFLNKVRESAGDDGELSEKELKKYKTSHTDDNGALIESSFLPDGEMSSKTITYKNNAKEEYLYMSDNTVIHNFYTRDGKLLERAVEEKDTDEVISRTLFKNDGEVSYFDNFSYPIKGLQKQISLKYIKCCDSDNILNVMASAGDYENAGTDEEKYISLADKVLSSDMPETEKREALKYLGTNLAAYAEKNDVYSFGIKQELETLLEDENFDLEKASDSIREFLLEIRKDNKKPNGDIDADFRQGQAGDCWFLAAIQALKNSPQGQALLNDSVDVDPETENITVTLKGVNKTYTITPQELKDADMLSFGDLDVRAMEIALQRYFKENPVMGKDTIDGNISEVAFKILSGSDPISIYSHITNPAFFEQLIQTNNKTDTNIFANPQQSIGANAPMLIKNKHFMRRCLI